MCLSRLGLLANLFGLPLGSNSKQSGLGHRRIFGLSPVAEEKTGGVGVVEWKLGIEASSSNCGLSCIGFGFITQLWSFGGCISSIGSEKLLGNYG
jgi:hypothetical protein